MLSSRYKNDGVASIKLNEKQRKSIAKYKQKLASSSSVYEHIDCPVCEIDDSEVLAEKDRYGFECKNVICKNCGLVYINPRMSNSFYTSLYKEDYRDIYSGQTVDYVKYFENRYAGGKSMFEFLNSKIPVKKGAKVLDVGCGIGAVLKYFKDQGCTIHGIDLGAEFIKYGRENHDLNLHLNTIFDVELDYAPDVIVYSHVFEHILDLNKEAAQLRNLLADDGVLLLEVPGVLNLTPSYNGNFMKYCQNAHTFSFSKNTLQNVMEKNGFELIHGNENVSCIFKKKAIPKKFTPTNSYQEISAYLKKMESARVFWEIRDLAQKAKDRAIRLVRR